MNNNFLYNDKFVIGQLFLKGTTEKERLINFRKELDILEENGINIVLIEDSYGSLNDIKNTLDYISIRKKHMVYGINILESYNFVDENYETAFHYADLYGASFVLVNDIINNKDFVYRKLYNLKEEYDDIKLLLGIKMRYQNVKAKGELFNKIRYISKHCDGIVSAREYDRTATTYAQLVDLKKELKECKLIASGINQINVSKQMIIADGCIVGSTLYDNGSINPENVKTLMKEVKKIRR